MRRMWLCLVFLCWLLFRFTLPHSVFCLKCSVIEVVYDWTTFPSHLLIIFNNIVYLKPPGRSTQRQKPIFNFLGQCFTGELFLHIQLIFVVQVRLIHLAVFVFIKFFIKPESLFTLLQLKSCPQLSSPQIFRLMVFSCNGGYIRCNNLRRLQKKTGYT